MTKSKRNPNLPTPIEAALIVALIGVAALIVYVAIFR